MLSRNFTVDGPRVTLRPVAINDAEFILTLRLDSVKNRYITPTSSDISAQRGWIVESQQDPDQVYFVICDREGIEVGTLRLYDPRGDSICWGSWIIKDGVPPTYAIESAVLAYETILFLGFEQSHFDVKASNKTVCEFHKRFGAKVVDRQDEDVYFQIDRTAILSGLDHYRKRLAIDVSINEIE